MAAPKTNAYHREILAAVGRGETYEQIAEGLNKEHGESFTARLIGDHVRRHRDERADVAQAVVRDALAPVVLSDLEELEQCKLRLRKLERRATKKGKYGEAIRAIREQIRVGEIKLKFAGAGTGENPPDQARESLVAKLEALVTKHGEPAPDPNDVEPEFPGRE